jgi:ABC-type bacteriocin/lantibiotic exporter with double-glycine peptidase domain
MIKLLSQQDPAWGNLELGNSGLKMKNFGCVTTCLSAVSSWYGSYINPGKLVAKLKYTDTGLLYWKSVNGVLPFNFVYRYYRQDDVKIKSILMSENNCCLLQISNYKHWVLLVGYSKIYGYKILDPYYGDVIYMTKRYPKAIQGFTEFTRR